MHTEDVDGGVAMVCVSTGDQDELRAREARMAKMHDEVEDVVGGARLVLIPRDPAEIPALVEHV